jgi:hypothetical protein
VEGVVSNHDPYSDSVIYLHSTDHAVQVRYSP